MSYFKFSVVIGATLLAWLVLLPGDQPPPDRQRLLIGLDSASLTQLELKTYAEQMVVPVLSPLGEVRCTTATINGHNAVLLQVVQDRHVARQLLPALPSQLPSTIRLRRLQNRSTIAAAIITAPHLSADQRLAVLNRIQQKMLGELAVNVIVAGINHDPSRLYITLKQQHPPMLEVLESLRRRVASVPGARVEFSRDQGNNTVTLKPSP